MIGFWLDLINFENFIFEKKNSIFNFMVFIDFCGQMINTEPTF